jgi:hypothetical protein
MFMRDESRRSAERVQIDRQSRSASGLVTSEDRVVEKLVEETDVQASRP